MRKLKVIEVKEHTCEMIMRIPSEHIEEVDINDDPEFECIDGKVIPTGKSIRTIKIFIDKNKGVEDGTKRECKDIIEREIFEEE